MTKIIVLLLTLISGSVFATEQYSNSAKVAIGTSRSGELTGTSLDARFNFEVGYERKLTDLFSAGLLASRNSASEANLSGLNFTMYRIGALATVAPTKDSFVGLRAGLALLKVDGRINISGLTFKVTSDTISPFFVGLVAGLNIPVADHFTFSPSISYDQVFENSDVNKFYQVDAMAALKYNF